VANATPGTFCVYANGLETQLRVLIVWIDETFSTDKRPSMYDDMLRNCSELVMGRQEGDSDGEGES